MRFPSLARRLDSVDPICVLYIAVDRGSTDNLAPRVHSRSTESETQRGSVSQLVVRAAAAFTMRLSPTLAPLVISTRVEVDAAQFRPDAFRHAGNRNDTEEPHRARRAEGRPSDCSRVQRFARIFRDLYGDESST